MAYKEMESTDGFEWPVPQVSLVVVVLVLSTLACTLIPITAPKHLKSTPSPRVAAEILEMPGRACLGEVITLSLRTVPGNKCDTILSFWGGDKHSTGLPTQIADSEGSCSWQWEIPSNAPPGSVSVYMSVQFEDIESSYLVPETVEISQCKE
jgi:hypothetical protein